MIFVWRWRRQICKRGVFLLLVSLSLIYLFHPKSNLGEQKLTMAGLYIHDLTYNAQKPAQVTTRAGEPLVNFERHRTTARIVKNLLRLIDASTKYSFQPVQGVIERCLWIASLSEEEIQARSRGLS